MSFTFTEGLPAGSAADTATTTSKKPAVRYSPRVIAAMRGQPIPEQQSDANAFRITYGRSAYVPNAERTNTQAKKPKSMQPKTAKPEEQPALEAGAAPDGILSTKDYSIFKFLSTNRAVDRRHVASLAAAIRKKNLLHLNPIVVNVAMEVIDGQHRLEAAKMCDVAIFYAQDAAISQDDIAGMNSNKKNWGLLDYVHFYTEKGIAEYLAFSRFKDEHPNIQVSTLMVLCTKDGNVKRTYKDGVIDVSGMEVARRTLEYLKDFAGHTPFYNSSRFVEALSFIVRTGLYDHPHMKGKLEKAPGLLQPAPTVKGWIENLERLYNRNVRENDIKIFLKRR